LCVLGARPRSSGGCNSFPLHQCHPRVGLRRYPLCLTCREEALPNKARDYWAREPPLLCEGFPRTGLWTAVHGTDVGHNDLIAEDQGTVAEVDVPCTRRVACDAR